jgi:hypothetical protein
MRTHQYPDDSALYDVLQATITAIEEESGCSCPEAERVWNIQDGDSEELGEDMPELVPADS